MHLNGLVSLDIIGKIRIVKQSVFRLSFHMDMNT
jgi:hypothetical protein